MVLTATWSPAQDKQAVKGVVTGKSVVCGGTPGREEATGRGLVHCISQWAKEKNFNLAGSTLAVQGLVTSVHIPP